MLANWNATLTFHLFWNIFFKIFSYVFNNLVTKVLLKSLNSIFSVTTSKKLSKNTENLGYLLKQYALSLLSKNYLISALPIWVQWYELTLQMTTKIWKYKPKTNFAIKNLNLPVGNATLTFHLFWNIFFKIFSYVFNDLVTVLLKSLNSIFSVNSVEWKIFIFYAKIIMFVADFMRR